MTNKIYYTKDHEWIEVISNNKVQIGITQHASEQLGDVVFVDYPQEDGRIKKDDTVVTVESVKSVSDVFAPVNGIILSVNESLTENPEVVNESPTKDAWMVLIEVENLSQLDNLMTEEQYTKFVEDNE